MIEITKDNICQYKRGLEVPMVKFLGGKKLGDCETDVARYQMCYWDQSCDITLKTKNGEIPLRDKDWVIKLADKEYFVIPEQLIPDHLLK